MIYTSYFANHRNFPKDFQIVCIARWAPKKFFPDFYAPELAPSQTLLENIKSGKITNQQYEVEFNNRLSLLDIQLISEKYQNCILLCYEKPSDFCHRHLVRKWLNDNDIVCQEL